MMTMNDSIDENINSNNNSNQSSHPPEVIKKDSTCKINFSLGGTKKKKKDTTKTKAQEFQNNASGNINIHDEDGEEYTTVAEAAIKETKRRKELGVDLVIPLNEKDSLKNKNEPILFGLKRIIQVTNDSDLNDTSVSNVVNEDSDEKDKSMIQSLNGPENNHDKEAEDALIKLAADNEFDKEQNINSSSTNFSSGGPSSLVIKQENESTSEHASETLKYQRDLKHRADDISVHSQSYVNVPIAEFGAAMLRGMGWKGQSNKNDEKEKDGNNSKTFNPRPHRLGLGATPLPPSMRNGDKGSNKRHRAKKGGTMDDLAHIEKEKEEERIWEQKMEEKKRNDVQITLQVGSIVQIRKDYDDNQQSGKRAKMMKIAGVPGLNRVLIRYEGEDIDVSVKKSDVVLVDKETLEKDPFHEKPLRGENEKSLSKEKRKRRGRSNSSSQSRERSQMKKSRRDQHHHSHSRDRSNSTENKRSSKDKKSRKERARQRHEEKSRDRKSHKRSDDASSRRDTHDYYDDRKSKKARYDHKNDTAAISEHWLTPNIRVRVISKKVAKGRQYKQKGVVMDVLHHGNDAVLHMDNGEVIESIPERYLETALPKVGGNVMILTGSNQFAKGKLLERNSNKGIAVIQLFDNMNVVTLSLDDISEWCGPLDDDDDYFH